MTPNHSLLPFEPDVELAVKAEIAGYLRIWTSHPAWEKFYQPQFEDAKHAATAMLVNPAPTRSTLYTDEYLRARINILEELLTMGARYIDDYERQREQQEEDNRAAVDLRDRTDMGHYGPLS